jgi:hypothetical protein
MKTTEQSATDFATLCNELGVTIQVSSPSACSNDTGWDHIAFACQISRNGQVFYSGPYRKGLGHVKIPASKGMAPMPFLGFRLTSDEENVLYTLQRKPGTNFKPGQRHVLGLYGKLAVKQKLTVTTEEFLASLVSDGDAYLDAYSFQDWCDNTGYDSDSIKAKGIYDLCDSIGRAISRTFTKEEIETLRELACEL